MTGWPKQGMFWVANLYSRVLVAHGWPVGVGYTGRTLCGLVVWDRENKRSLGHFIRSDHARLIGRPCQRCW